MAVATLRNVGGSVMVTVPKPVLDELGLLGNTKVNVTAENGKIVMAPRARPKYTLEELVAEWTPWPERSQEEQQWMDMPSVGNEIID